MNTPFLVDATTATPDITYVKGRNAHTTTINAGSMVCLDLETSGGNGIDFNLPNTTNIGSFIGVLAEAVPSGGYTGKIIWRGPYDTAYVEGNVTCAVGSTLKLVAGDRAAVYYSTGPASPVGQLLILRESYTTTLEATKKIFVRP